MTTLDGFPSELQPDADHATDADLYSQLYEYAAGLEARLDAIARTDLEVIAAHARQRDTASGAAA